MAAPQAADEGLRPVRYAVGTALVSVWIMLAALHLPVDDWLPPSFEIALYPSFSLFLPWSLFLMRLFPWDATGFGAGDRLALCAMDLLAGAAICLPLLFPRGRKQNVAAIVSLSVAGAYTLWAILFHFRGPTWLSS